MSAAADDSEQDTEGASNAGNTVSALAEGRSRGGQTVAVPPLTRMATQIPKLKNHQDFQRACVVLYRAELNDPHAQEYGRNGQAQRGLDILGCRDGNPDHPVAIQCRCIDKPLKKGVIASDCREALGLKPNLREIIFATTAPNDTHATNAADEVERELRQEGFAVRVIVYGWDQLQTIISLHDVAYAVFHPSSAAPTNAIRDTPEGPSSSSAEEIARAVIAGLQQHGVALNAQEPDRDNWHLEDPALHARIDTYRDLFKNDQLILPAQQGLRDLLAQMDQAAKPWAHFRIEINLGSIAIELGREEEAIAHFEAAYAIKPGDAHAIANLALARTIGGRFDEGMALGREALEATPRADSGVAYLLQAAARSDWQGDPESLIPDDLAGSLAADLGLAEFLRRREIPGWPERVIAIAERHAGTPEFKPMKATAVLALAVETDATVAGARGNATREQIDEAADFLLELCERYLATGFADQSDLLAYLNNAAILLRLCDRQVECEALLTRALPLVGDASPLRRILALSQVAQGRMDDARATLAGDDDTESQMLLAEMLLFNDPDQALAIARRLTVDANKPRLDYMRWRLIAETGLRMRQNDVVHEAIEKLDAMERGRAVAALLTIRLETDDGADKEATAQRLLTLVSQVDATTDFLFRFELAEALAGADEPGAAADLLHDHVDLSRASIPTGLYLRSLALARRDTEFQKALDGAPDSVRFDPDLLWGQAAHYWNIGDLEAAQAAVTRLLDVRPDNGRAHLLRLEILMRRDQTGELLTALEAPLENLKFAQLEDGLSLARVLAHFGQIERGAALAYRLFLSNRNLSPAWMALSGIVLEEGQGDRSQWDAEAVGLDAAVDVEFEDGEKRFLVVEADAALRAIDPESVEPEHPLIQQLWGKKKGDKFETADGRKGTIIQLRHKIVARFHYILEHHKDRFPNVGGFQSVTLTDADPAGIQSILEVAKARRDWIEQEQQAWATGMIPLALFARRVGGDTIDVAAGLAQSGQTLKVAVGNEVERQAAIAEIEANAGRGCTLELHSFWTAWQLKTLDTITALCGKIHVAQSLMDDLRRRRENIAQHCNDGLKSAGYEDGKLVITDTAAEAMEQARDDTQAAITWLESNATVCPVVLSDDVPEEVRNQLRSLPYGLFDGVIVAVQTNTLLISDDLFVRAYLGLIGGKHGAWSHAVLQTAQARGLITLDDGVRLAANLIEAGHSYLGTNGLALACAARIDYEAGNGLGYNFRTLASTIGGPIAEPPSHFAACRECLTLLWQDSKAVPYREPATGHLLRQLIRSRHSDYGILLASMLVFARNFPALQNYIFTWLQGHFIPASVINAAINPSAARRGVRRGRKSKTRT